MCNELIAQTNKIKLNDCCNIFTHYPNTWSEHIEAGDCHDFRYNELSNHIVNTRKKGKRIKTKKALGACA